MKALNSSAFHDDITYLELKSEHRTVLAKKEYKISLESVSVSSHPNLTKSGKGCEAGACKICYGLCRG